MQLAAIMAKVALNLNDLTRMVQDMGLTIESAPGGHLGPGGRGTLTRQMMTVMPILARPWSYMAARVLQPVSPRPYLRALLHWMARIVAYKPIHVALALLAIVVAKISTCAHYLNRGMDGHATGFEGGKDIVGVHLERHTSHATRDETYNVRLLTPPIGERIFTSCEGSSRHLLHLIISAVLS